MNFSKKLICLFQILIFLLLTSFTGCKKDVSVKIGIMQIVDHESLNDARQGFTDELKNLGYGNVEIDFQNAGGELSNCVSIAEKFVNNKKDLILAISTPCAQAASNLTEDIPILATAITDFEGAGLVKSNEKPGTNVTGTSDLAPIDKIIELILRLNPDAKKVGILYSNTDASPKYQAEVAEKEIKKLGLEAELATVSNTQEIQQVAEKLSRQVDALYTPIDKITFSAMPQISKIFLDNNKFVVCAEDAMIPKGAAGTFCISYYELGKKTAQQAVKILKGEASPENMSVEHLYDSKLALNHEIIKKLGLKVSEQVNL